MPELNPLSTKFDERRENRRWKDEGFWSHFLIGGQKR
jgi:hypothetical protein